MKLLEAQIVQYIKVSNSDINSIDKCYYFEKAMLTYSKILHYMPDYESTIIDELLKHT